MAPVPDADYVDPDALALLNAKPELYKVVCEAVEHMRQAFDTPEQTEIRVESFVDIEGPEDATPQIRVVAYTRQPGAVETLKKLRRNWWFANRKRGGGRFGLSVQAATA